MRLFKYLLQGHLAFGNGNSTELGTSMVRTRRPCSDREIRLWLHLDLTGSFTKWRLDSFTALRASLMNLAQNYPKLRYGISGFGDRPNGCGLKPLGQVDDLCYVQGVDFADPVGDNKFARIHALLQELKPSYFDLEEDPLSALPWIAKHKFGAYREDELRILTVLTDHGPHYGPDYRSGEEDLAGSVEDLVTCDANKRFATLSELFDPVKARRILPVITVYPGQDCVNKWVQALTGAGYDAPDHLVDLGPAYDPSGFVNAVEKLIEDNQCRAAPTHVPSNPDIVVDDIGDDGKCCPCNDASHAIQGTRDTNSSPRTSKVKNSHIIAGASVGAVALAAGTGYVFYKKGMSAGESASRNAQAYDEDYAGDYEPYDDEEEEDYE